MRMLRLAATDSVGVSWNRTMPSTLQIRHEGSFSTALLAK